MRRGELIGLTLEDLDLEQDVVRQVLKTYPADDGKVLGQRPTYDMVKHLPGYTARNVGDAHKALISSGELKRSGRGYTWA